MSIADHTFDSLIRSCKTATCISSAHQVNHNLENATLSVYDKSTSVLRTYSYVGWVSENNAHINLFGWVWKLCYKCVWTVVISCTSCLPRPFFFVFPLHTVSKLACRGCFFCEGIVSFTDTPNIYYHYLRPCFLQFCKIIFYLFVVRRRDAVTDPTLPHYN